MLYPICIGTIQGHHVKHYHSPRPASAAHAAPGGAAALAGGGHEAAAMNFLYNIYVIYNSIVYNVHYVIYNHSMYTSLSI